MRKVVKKEPASIKDLIFSLMTTMFWFGNKVPLSSESRYEGRIVRGSELCLLNDVKET